jgi:hypothetical protein
VAKLTHSQPAIPHAQQARKRTAMLHRRARPARHAPIEVEYVPATQLSHAEAPAKRDRGPPPRDSRRQRDSEAAMEPRQRAGAPPQHPPSAAACPLLPLHRSASAHVIQPGPGLLHRSPAPRDRSADAAIVVTRAIFRHITASGR